MNQQQQAHRVHHILEEMLGHVVLVGTEDKVSLRAALASAGVLHVMGDPHDVARASVTSDELGLASIELIETNEKGIPQLPHLMASLAILERPDSDVEVVVIETLLTQLGDDGALFIDIKGGGIGERRIRRLVESLCVGIAENAWAEEGRLSITARRRPRGKPAIVDPLDEVLPVAVLIPTRNRVALAMEVVVDVLFRQSIPPALLVILDDAGPGEEQVPDDLWGFVESCTTQPAILRTGGVGKAVALNIGLEHVEQPYVAVIDDDDRLAAGALLSLATALEENPEWVAVASDALIIDGAGAALGLRPLPSFEPAEALTRLMEGCVYLQPGTMIRRESLMKTKGYNERLQRLQDYDMWLQLAAQGPIGTVHAPLSMVRRHEGNARNPHIDQLIQLSAIEVMKAFLEDCSLECLAASLVELTTRAATARALELRGRALARVGMVDRALEDYEAWSEICPDDSAPCLARATIHARASRWELASEMALRARDLDSDSLLARSAVIYTAYHSGQQESAQEEAKRLSEEAPGFLVGLQQHLFLAAEHGDPEVLEALERITAVLHSNVRPGSEFLLSKGVGIATPDKQRRT